MTLAVLVIVSTATVLLLLLYGATVELYRQVLQLRLHAGLTDAARPLDFNREVHVADLGLPASRGAGDDDAHRKDSDASDAAASDDDAVAAQGGHRRLGRQAVLILSDSCTTCGDVARGLGGEPASGLVVLVESRNAAAATAWLEAQGLAAGDGVIYDEAGRMAGRLGVSVTPAAVRFEGDQATAASTVPSSRQLDALTAWLRGRDARLTTGMP